MYAQLLQTIQKVRQNYSITKLYRPYVLVLVQCFESSLIRLCVDFLLWQKLYVDLMHGLLKKNTVGVTWISNTRSTQSLNNIGFFYREMILIFSPKNDIYTTILSIIFRQFVFSYSHCTLIFYFFSSIFFLINKKWE